MIVEINVYKIKETIKHGSDIEESIIDKKPTKKLLNTNYIVLVSPFKLGPSCMALWYIKIDQRGVINSTYETLLTDYEGYLKILSTGANGV